jgi:hypothetical protein
LLYFLSGLAVQRLQQSWDFLLPKR